MCPEVRLPSVPIGPSFPIDRVAERPAWRFSLIALALLPLTGASWFAARELLQVSSSQDKAGVVDEDTRQLVQLTGLRANLFDERNWRLAAQGVGDIGISPDLVSNLIGIDLVDEWTIAEANTDRIATELADPQINDLLEQARVADGAELVTVGQRYAVIEEYLADQGDLVFAELMSVAGDLPSGAELIRNARVLEAAATTRQSVASQLSSYYSARFSSPTTGQLEIDKLLEQRALYARALAQIESAAAPDSRATAQLLRINDSEGVRTFDVGAAELIEEFRSGNNTMTGGGMSFVTEDFSGVTRQFEAGKVSSDIHLDLVTAAGNDVIESGRALTDAATARTRQAIVTIVVLIITSVAFALALTRFIGQPLSRLADTAEQLRDGTGNAAVNLRGPIEVRQATQALNEASSHLRLVERQATALAQGDLSASVLAETAPGGIGVSLQRAVQTLAASMSEREEFRLRIAHEVSHDGLTQLPNRRACVANLETALQSGENRTEPLAVIFVDLDGFKVVNDQLGHPAGDLVLETMAARLLSSVRDGDLVGRLGGDEFVVIADTVRGVDHAVQIGQRVLDLLDSPISIGKSTVRIGASVGIAIGDLGRIEQLTADDLFREADLALHKAKALGRNQLVVCDEVLRALNSEQSETEQALRRAIETDQLLLFYQDIVDPLVDQSIGLEALIRWERPGVGMVPPDAFIPFAERSDLIVEIDCWVIDRAARQMAEWQAAGMPLLPVSINISGRHLSVDCFVDDVLGPLTRHGVSPELIIIEVTESALLDDLGGAAEKLTELRAQGVKVAIDDFGTGYTSLAHLKTLPIDILKIDQSFTRDRAADSLVKLIIDTGHLLGVSITAEGIETAEQAALLAAMGTDDLQGYHYGRPRPADQLILPALQP